MVWPVRHGMIYGMAWRSWHGICNGMAGITWPGKVCGKALYFPEYYMLYPLPWTIVLFTRGVADVSWRSCSHVPDPFTSRGPFMYVPFTRTAPVHSGHG